MRKPLSIFTGAVLIALCLAACGGKPNVTAVPITPPWSTMNLPVKENAVVWGSTPQEFKAVHTEDKKTVMGKYVDALKAQGWALTNLDDKSADRYYVDMTKGADKIQMEFYDFEKNAGVIIKKK
ncbi:MAG TPA: hypothetical protein VGC91_16465 [Pyrinomonadaceae bacterium]|jgi:hypothetical protein